MSILAVVVLAGLVAGPATAGDEAATLKARAAAWEKAFNDSKLDAVAAMYAKDGSRMPPNAPAANGHDAILAQLKESRSMMGGVVIEASDAVVEGNMGISHGRYKIKGKDGAIVDEGKWVSVGKKVNGEWTTVRDIWNSDRPLPTPAK
jgi:ketosteroid isomerase-like protein